MAAIGSHFLFILSALLLASLPVTTQLQPSQIWSLLKVQQLLNRPPMLRHWRRSTDFCGGGGGTVATSAVAAVVCYGDTVTQLHIAGGATGAPPLPRNFSMAALVTTLSRLPDLTVLTLSGVGLWGPIPRALSRLASLEILNMSSNYLYGPIPLALSRLGALQTLILDNNMIGGELPGWIGGTTLPSLALLSLRNNSLSGPVPEELGRMPSLRSLALASNNLSGDLPDLRGLASLREIDVSGNSLGPAFPRLGRKVASVVLGRNRFAGGLPAAELGEFYLLEWLDVSRNRFVGPLPPALLSLPSLRYLNVAGNRFTGALSGDVPCGDNLRLLDLSLNLLTGSVPACLRPGGKTETVVISSENCFDGSDGSQQHPSSFCQNQALAVGIGAPQDKERKRASRHAGFVAGIVIAVLVAVSLVGVMAFFAVRKMAMDGAKTRPSVALVEEQHASSAYPSKLFADARYISQTVKLGALGIPSYRSFSLVELEAATNNFANSCLLGQDSYGEMYLGKLSNGAPVTIRSLKVKRNQSSQSFNRHIETISRLRHRHLVSALGHCFEYDLDDSTVTQLYLVFEYVHNGNLRSRISQGTEGRKLTWGQRISAAIGVAKGIQFLHARIIPGLFGNNLRINNILLDQNHVAKIGSYNIPILGEAAKIEGVAGSKHQADSTMLGDKIDIFDFGVILLELVSGKPITSIYEVEIMKELGTQTPESHSAAAAMGNG
ncbi:probable inactive leucine-rich repeat receptor-like protein kinase At3g03770 isoform X2 [Brachypodium distachyon]|uniref:Protein kinase domain-containing protein n=1 Tax=Brachypodium distachyon TaxID=15368 RepID=A0A0Q3GQX3_BRADI|nr:probable inactive leucine-rich repeat receptor-like protein kinase At3g03770 isoform X2 [Brachypodium distachyon]KQK12805.1 hypothetical protein BRADI_1g06100v3 [Brachypodium distachyon]|eukprot:XP_014752453.1 probable inactive leucine-rich repeat receptor-like protein kinase At3g03770 isoform X2 [Brachypodium distachyon]